MSAAWNEADRSFMRQALELATRGRGSTRPNPIVGALVVRDGKVLARGFHRQAGLPHAGVEALQKLAFHAEGATLYATLEPCCHQGRTGPCTEMIRYAGIKRVVVACRDENPLVRGRGITALRRNGIQVDIGCLDDECRYQNRAFFTWIRDRRPWITLKAAATMDGCIGDGNEKRRKGNERWITGPKARALGHTMRAQHDAILVGVGTILADDPRLTVRSPDRTLQRGRSPLRVVLDSHLRTNPRAAFLHETRDAAALIVAAKPSQADPALDRRRRKLEATGAEVLFVRPGRDGRTALTSVLRLLADREIQSVLVEGGSKIHSAFIAAGAVDAIALFLAPRLVGSGVPIVEGNGTAWRSQVQLGPISVQELGGDLLLTADVAARKLRRHI